MQTWGLKDTNTQSRVLPIDQTYEYLLMSLYCGSPIDILQWAIVYISLLVMEPK